MSVQDYEQLTLFPADSPASPSPLPGSVEARRMTVTSGLKCSESLENCGPVGSLVRMLLESSIWRSTQCSLTWKKKDMRGGDAYSGLRRRRAAQARALRNSGLP